MFKIGDKINYGFYSNVDIVDEDDEHFILEDCNKNHKKVYKYLVEKHGSLFSSKTENTNKLKKNDILLTDGSVFHLSSLSKSDVTCKRLLALLTAYKVHQLHPYIGLNIAIQQYYTPDLNKNRMQTELCLVLLYQTKEPEKNLRKALGYMGFSEEIVNLEIGKAMKIK